MFKVLGYFHRSHGHCEVPTNPRKNSLGHWLACQRDAARAGRLSATRLKRLQSLGVDFSPPGQTHARTKEELWNEKFLRLVAFKKQFGHCDVPCHGKEDRVLGHWVSNQRNFRKKALLSEERIRRLDKIGFRWVALYNRNAPPDSFRELIKTRDDFWDSMFAAVVRYKKKHGHCNVRPKDGMNGRLYKWAGARRTEARKGLLRQDRHARLDSIGFPWKVRNPHCDNWDKHFAKLVAFKKQFSHCDVPCHWKKDRLFGHWVSNQRSFRKKGILSEERIRRLNEIGFKWEALTRIPATS